MSFVAAFGFGLLLATATSAAVNISTQPTQNMSCSAGACNATAQKAYLNVNDVTSMLAAGDLKIVAGSGAQDIHIEAPFSWTSTSRLTLDAQRSIEFKKSVTVAGTGALTLNTNNGGTGGDYWFDPGASVTFLDTHSSLIINGQSFTLVRDIKTLASDIAKNPSGNFALAHNYDASTDGTYAAAPVGTEFSGAFDGLGSSISNLTIVSTTPGWIGLFAVSVRSAVLRDLQLLNVYVNATGAIGALVGSNNGSIIRAHITGQLSGGLHNSSSERSSLGGITGQNWGTISHSTSEANLTGAHYAGGGISGYNSGLIVLSWASGGVHSGYSDGGLVGYNYDGDIEQSYASGDIAGAKLAGGLVGMNGNTQPGFGTARQCYARGAAGGRRMAGGLVGDVAAGVISQCYATGKVNKGQYSGGLAGDVYYQYEFDHSYWDVTTSRERQATGVGDVDGVLGLTDAQLKSALPDGFDPQVWGQNPNINDGYPYLLANPPPH